MYTSNNRANIGANLYVWIRACLAFVFRQTFCKTSTVLQINVVLDPKEFISSCKLT